MTDFGGDYCRDDQNRFCGHIRQIASNKATGMILIRCARRSTLYQNTFSRRGPNTTPDGDRGQDPVPGPSYRLIPPSLWPSRVRSALIHETALVAGRIASVERSRLRPLL